MLESPLVLAAIGSVLGFLAGSGVGGGSLFLLWLTMIQGIPEDQAKIMNLLFFIPSALSSLFFKRKSSPPDYKIAAETLLCSLIGAELAQIFSFSGTLLRKILGILLIICGIRQITYRERN